jgi:Rieske 2Fe-2S family protein
MAEAPTWVPPESPFSREEVAGPLRPLEEAEMLPARAYCAADVFDFEQEHWFGRDWLCVGRESDAASVGSWFVARRSPTSAGAIVVRSEDGSLRAVHNVCRHRGMTLLDGCGVGVSRIVCPYHAWSYDLRGRLVSAPATRQIPGFDREVLGLRPVQLETFGGFVFINLAWDTVSLRDWLDDLPAQFDGIPLEGLVLGRRASYDVAANWKLLMENFAESYHFGPVHSRLERHTPSRQAESLDSRGPWQGGWMPLAPGSETVSTDGKRHGRALLRTQGAHRHGVLDYVVWPNLFLSLQPDYLLAYRLEPLSATRTRVVLDVLFDAASGASAAGAAIEAPDVFDFWDGTNREDFAICEGQQLGIASPGYVPGRYTPQEEGVYEFDKIAAERYADP